MGQDPNVPDPRRHHPRLIATGLLGAATAVLAGGCSSSGTPLDIFQGDGSQSQTINNLQKPVFLAAGIVGILVLSATVFIAFKFRSKGDDDGELPSQTHGALGLELGWTILPAVILAVVAVGTVVTIFDLAKTPSTASSGGGPSSTT
jgi:cytochrome c oxidase subunit 2